MIWVCSAIAYLKGVWVYGRDWSFGRTISNEVECHQRGQIQSILNNYAAMLSRLRVCLGENHRKRTHQEHAVFFFPFSLVKPPSKAISQYDSPQDSDTRAVSHGISTHKLYNDHNELLLNELKFDNMQLF